MKDADLVIEQESAFMFIQIWMIVWTIVTTSKVSIFFEPSTQEQICPQWSRVTFLSIFGFSNIRVTGVSGMLMLSAMHKVINDVVIT